MKTSSVIDYQYAGTKSRNGSPGTIWDGYDTDYGHGRLSTWDTTNMNPYSDIWSSAQKDREGKITGDGLTFSYNIASIEIIWYWGVSDF